LRLVGGGGAIPAKIQIDYLITPAELYSFSPGLARASAASAKLI